MTIQNSNDSVVDADDRTSQERIFGAAFAGLWPASEAAFNASNHAGVK